MPHRTIIILPLGPRGDCWKPYVESWCYGDVGWWCGVWSLSSLFLEAKPVLVFAPTAQIPRTVDMFVCRVFHRKDVATSLLVRSNMPQFSDTCTLLTYVRVSTSTDSTLLIHKAPASFCRASEFEVWSRPGLCHSFLNTFPVAAVILTFLWVPLGDYMMTSHALFSETKFHIFLYPAVSRACLFSSCVQQDL